MTYTDDDRRAHDAMMGDLLADDTRIYPPAADYVQDLDRGPWAEQARKREPIAWDAVAFWACGVLISWLIVFCALAWWLV